MARSRKQKQASRENIKKAQEARRKDNKSWFDY